MKITVFGPLRSAAGEKTVDVSPSGETVRDLLTAFVDEYPTSSTHLLDDDDTIRPSVRVMVGERKAALDDPITDGEQVKLFPAMRGG
ncbi:ubiquitin-like small modifier protein 1 [Haloferax profundi]|uniref:Molybdopterin synthase sulfur carrier subunit n=1 Tax=Haloferax profundi TaxID=1544718 RepID=A0A0W1RMA1_9EURY|nr:ubiquitin-like small modifier protein 1 [Haloferax profundi]KTG14720.1 molybdopterin synthase sulfur carrier subunit [Haloferax profundi]